MKQKTVFLCGDCGYESPKWYGKCPSCGAWNTMSEFKEKPVSAARGTNTFQRGESRPTLLKDIDTGDESRFHSGIGELDRVLGGGAVHGSFVLVGGEPGIGKSTAGSSSRMPPTTLTYTSLDDRNSPQRFSRMASSSTMRL